MNPDPRKYHRLLITVIVALAISFLLEIAARFLDQYGGASELVTDGMGLLALLFMCSCGMYVIYSLGDSRALKLAITLSAVFLVTSQTFNIANALPDDAARLVFTTYAWLFDPLQDILFLGGLILLIITLFIALMQTAYVKGRLEEERQTLTREIAERHRAERERQKLESQLWQSQKMDAVGRLAGGVAHDFNNMLSVILGHAELARETVDPSGPVRHDIDEIITAGRRSADLISQLLGFARKQTITPKALDLNDTIENTLKMLRRLIGENINLVWKPVDGVWRVKMDPAQVDQVLANLAVNARDAVREGGTVTIETDNVELREDAAGYPEDFTPGEYVLLRVRDNGCGMHEDTLTQLFEPFYTTKPRGEGTGLGLATVYGIVKQNNGLINVTSKPKEGATFEIYLPRHVGDDTASEAFKEPSELETGKETILVVEDEEMLLSFTRRVLERLGYNVLAAGHGRDALKMAEAYPDDIDLLLTDVVMPDINGQALWEQLHGMRPGMKRLFMSGYTEDIIARHGRLTDGVAFMQKPFNMETLATKVRSVLRSEGASANDSRRRV